MSKRLALAPLLAILLLTPPAAAQLAPDIGGALDNLGSGLDQMIGNMNNAGGARGLLDRTATGVGEIGSEGGRSGVDGIIYGSRSAASLETARRQRLDMLVEANRNVLERDRDGNPIRKAVVVAINPTQAQLAAALRVGFRLRTDEQDRSLGLRMVTLDAPRKMSAFRALQQIRNVAPGIEADYDHVYEPAGTALLPTAGALATAAAQGGSLAGRRLGMIDGGVASHPSLRRAKIEQRGFAGAPQATGHGTAIASLLVGDQLPFRGAARGSTLFVADVYGGNPAAGSATAMVRALSWLAAKKAQVISISLVGPANKAVAHTISVLRERGIAVVAAVGNDGPAAPHQYPASYDGVIAVTGVDGKGRALIEAGRAKHLDFAGPGSDLVAAMPGNGFTRVRGTSFAAPFVAARLAATGSIERLGAEARPGKGRVGRGIICSSCPIHPKVVGAK